MNQNDNKNLIVAMVLMLAVWFGFSIFFPPEQPAVPESVSSPVAEQVAPVASLSDIPSDSRLQPVVAESTPAPVTVQSAREIVVETDLYRAVFTSSGGRLLSYELKNFREAADPQAPQVQLFEAGPLHYATLTTSGFEGLHIPEDLVYSVEQDERLLVQGAATGELVFSASLPSGLQVDKVFVFKGNDYTLDSRLVLVNNSLAPLRGMVDFSLVKRWDKERDKDTYSFAGPASLVNDKFVEVDVDDLVKTPVVYGPETAWTSFQTKYFLSVVVPSADAAARTRILIDGDRVENIVETAYTELAAGERRQFDYFLFIGPKDINLLKQAGHRLDLAVDFGFFDMLAKPLLYALIFFYGFLNNYGLAIILLTVLIKLLFWPLTHKSYASMKAMQKLQPEMQKIREKFKDDKERLNRELMELYKTHRVNPLGGCLPMLVQIPVFFSLYKVLLDSIALRHAPFALWITDLSAKDPYYITPLLMGASMFVQQKLTPTTADPMQARIFMMMPVIFTFLFLNFPSGLVIYWLVNNLLTIVQQFYIHKRVK
ncbi:MAG: membrane protein insertase YidC [Desulfuromonadales bacterium]|nr:membrane protein insertase YidC [Desulfuromonadales bacterium]